MIMKWWKRVTQREFDGLTVVGWGPFVLPGERKRRVRSLAEAQKIVKALRKLR